MSPSQKKKGPKDKPEPAQQYDTTFKDWIRTVAREVLPILLPGAVYEETLDVEAIKPTMQGVDHVLMRKAMDELFEFCRGREESFAEQFVWMEVL